MKKLIIHTNSEAYPVLISDTFLALPDELQVHAKTCVIVTDSNVGPLHLDAFIKQIKDCFSRILVYTIPAGEDSKSIEQAKEIYQFLITNTIFREDIIVALGGGVTGDLTGYVASTYLRGIKYIQVPTTLLSQVDSSVGGKTAVNFMHVKNVIGAFYPPAQVQINYNVLKTLPIREIRSGLVEILVHAIIKDLNLFVFLEDNLERIEKLDPGILEDLIYRNCNIKKNVVEQDEYECSERALLNFGHTYGHAIETSYAYRYRHGECVAIGIIGACYIAEKLNLIDNTITFRIKQILKRMHVLNPIHDCDKKEVMRNIMHDKKTSENKIHFVLPHSIGSVEKFEIPDVMIIHDTLDILIQEEWER